MIRVLHVRNSDRPSGPERLILEQCAAASPAVVPAVASFGREGAPHEFLDKARERGIEAVLLEQAGSYDLRVVRRLREAIDRLKPDVLVGHDYKANLVIALSGRSRRRPRAAIVHGYTAEDRKVALFEAADRRILRRVDAVVAVSESMRAALVASGVDPARVHVIENGIPVDRVASEAARSRAAVRAEWRLASGDFAFLFLGRLSPEKGADVLLEALATAAPRLGARAVLVFVGEGASRAAIERRALALQGERRLLPGQVRFQGWRDDPWACLGAADAFVMPSRREGLPLSLLEAMAAGTPVIASGVGGVPEALSEGRCGALVPPDDVAALSVALVSLAHDPSSADAMRAFAAARVRDRYGVLRQARALEALYSRLASTALNP